MKLQKKRFSAIIAFALTLTIATTLITCLPFTFGQEDKLTITLLTGFYPMIGVNSPTEISWTPRPADINPIIVSPAYQDNAIWDNATVTFTRPDNTTDVINGPFKARHSLVQGRATRVDVVLIYAPDMMGEWTVNFYWPGDSTYNEANQTDTFNVGPHHEKREVECFLSLRPYPVVGLGQDVLVNAWVSMPPISQRDYYENITFTFTSPTDHSFVVGPVDTELPGTVWFNLPLNELGNWSITMDYPGNHISKPATVTRHLLVQDEAVQVGYPDTPLPTEEWSFPINLQNREWRNIAGPWYQRENYNASKGAWNPYTTGPKSAHILWKIPSPEQIGGFIGAPHSIETGSGRPEYHAGDTGIYDSSVPNIACCMAGRGFYSLGGMIHSVDMFTGEELWAVEGSFDMGSSRDDLAVLYDFSSSAFRCYNAITGELIFDVPGININFFADPYCYSNTGDYLVKWTVETSTSNFENRVIWNVTNDLVDPGVGAGNTFASYLAVHDGVWVLMGHNRGPQMSIIPTQLKGINLTTGETIYNRTPVTDPGDITTWFTTQGPATGSGFGLFYFAAVREEIDGLSYMAIDIKTGEEAWISERTDYPWGNFWAYSPQPSAHGMIFGLSVSGVYAFNVTNGEIVWHYIAEDTYFEEPYASNIDSETGEPYASYAFASVGGIVGGDVLYAPNSEHSPTLLYRGMGLHAIDVFSGEKLWSILGYHNPNTVAYGILTTSDGYNGWCWAFGKGSTETTVSIQNDVIPNGNSVLIKGTVLDMSPAQEGTPAIADDDQTPWMEYLHMQQPKPTDIEGVPVRLQVVAADGTVTDIATVTSDMYGQYAYLWEPPAEGTYKILAAFEGSESYWSSSAQTAVGVMQAPAPGTPIPPTTEPPTTPPPTTEPPTTPPPTTEPPTTPPPTSEPPTEAPLITTEVAIALAVAVAAVIGIGAYWVLRRQRSK